MREHDSHKNVPRDFTAAWKFETKGSHQQAHEFVLVEP